jgi:hypothetical protein
MSDVVPLRSKAERTVDTLRSWLASEELGEIKGLIVIVRRPDDTIDVSWSRQQLSELLFSSARLEQEIRWILDGAGGPPA